jgi:hypothetical protein
MRVSPIVEESETEIPHYLEKDDFIFWDTAGNEETRTPIHILVNAFLLRRLF